MNAAQILLLWHLDTNVRAAAFACDALPASAVLPSLVVLDLDATLWTPELYQLRKLPGYRDASGADVLRARAECHLGTRF